MEATFLRHEWEAFEASRRNGQTAANVGVLSGVQSRCTGSQIGMMSSKSRAKSVRYSSGLDSHSHWQYYCVARVKIEDVYSDAETEKNEHFHYGDHRQVGRVFD